MKIRKQLLCLHGSESRTKAIPNLIFIQRRGEITISPRLIWVSFGGRAKIGPTGERGSGGAPGEDVCRLNKAGKLFSCNVDGCCLRSHNEDVADWEAEIASDMSVTRSAAPWVSAPEINRTRDGQQREFDWTNCCNIIMSPMLLDMSSFLFEKKTELISWMYFFIFFFFKWKPFPFVQCLQHPLLCLCNICLFFHTSTRTLQWHMFGKY